MKYYKLIDPDLMSQKDEDGAVYFGWQKILSPLLEKGDEEGVSFLSELLVNIPVLEDNGEIIEKTVLMARLSEDDDEEEGFNSITTYDFPEDDFSLYYEI